MNHIIFLASGRGDDFHDKKKLQYWQHLLNNYGYPYTQDVDGTDTYIVVDDHADPFFKPKENPLHMASE